MASKEGCKTLAFPLISAGVYGYPKDQAVQVAVETIQSFLLTHDVSVTLVLFDRDAATVSKSLFTDISSYIDAQFIKEHADQDRNAFAGRLPFTGTQQRVCPCPPVFQVLWKRPPSHIDESFSQMLLRKIDAAGLTDAQCYKKANIDRKFFSKIRNDPHYRPSKPTAPGFRHCSGVGFKRDSRTAQESRLYPVPLPETRYHRRVLHPSRKLRHLPNQPSVIRLRPKSPWRIKMSPVRRPNTRNGTSRW